MPSKMSGRLIKTPNDLHDLKIYVKFHKAKKKGKDRIWISIRQDVPKRWRTAATLSYVKGIDVHFSREKRRY